MAIPLRLSTFARGAGGVPSTTLVPPFASDIDSYRHSISATFGFESMQATYRVPLADALDWLLNGLMRSVIVTGPDAQTVWEGFVTTIEVTIGQERRSLSLDSLGNRVRAKYTSFGVPGVTATQSSAESIALYGTKDYVISSGGVLLGFADALVAQELARRAFPQMQSKTAVTSGDPGSVDLTISCAGWYAAFDWLIYGSTSTSNATRLTLLTNLTNDYNAINAFF